MRTATGKGNDARKILTYYRVNFGIHPAYKVLCDAPIIHVSILRSIFLKDSLTKLLGAVAYPVVTRCIVEELRSLGGDFANAAVFAKRAAREPCAHGGAQKTASECIAAFMGSGNQKKLLLATNDYEVIRQALEEGDIPVITIANQTRLVLRKPTAMSIENVKQMKEQGSAVLRPEEKVLLAQTDAANRTLKPRRGIVRKRKRAKGPNPLSIKRGKRGNESLLNDVVKAADVAKDMENGVSNGGRNEEVVKYAASDGDNTKSKGRGRRRRKRRQTQNESEKQG